MNTIKVQIRPDISNLQVEELHKAFENLHKALQNGALEVVKAHVGLTVQIGSTVIGSYRA